MMVTDDTVTSHESHDSRLTSHDDDDDDDDDDDGGG
jgi:hypothetical protein